MDTNTHPRNLPPYPVLFRRLRTESAKKSEKADKTDTPNGHTHQTAFLSSFFRRAARAARSGRRGGEERSGGVGC